MEQIYHEATDRTPLVDFNFPEHHLLIQGESYPEDAAAFFGPLLEALRGFVYTPRAETLVMDLKMSYFNSSSAKALMNMFQVLETAAAEGNPVEVNWYYHPDDDAMEEFGEDFSEDFQHAAFHMRPLNDGGAA